MPLHGVGRCTRKVATVASLGIKRQFLDRIHWGNSKVTQTTFCQWSFFPHLCKQISFRYKKWVKLAEKKKNRVTSVCLICPSSCNREVLFFLCTLIQYLWNCCMLQWNSAAIYLSMNPNKYLNYVSQWINQVANSKFMLLPMHITNPIEYNLLFFGRHFILI